MDLDRFAIQHEWNHGHSFFGFIRFGFKFHRAHHDVKCRVATVYIMAILGHNDSGSAQSFGPDSGSCGSVHKNRFRRFQFRRLHFKVQAVPVHAVPIHEIPAQAVPLQALVDKRAGGLRA